METAAAAALGIALSPLPLLVVAALLGSSGKLHTAAAFVGGQAFAIGGLAAIVVVTAASRVDEASFDSAFALAELSVGSILALLLVIHLVRRADQGRTARLLALLDRVRPPVAFVTGIAMVAVKPKSLVLALVGGAAILDFNQSRSLEAASVFAFTAVAVSPLLAALVAYALAPVQGAAVLARGRALMLRHERVVVAVVLAVLAAYFLVRGLRDLAA